MRISFFVSTLLTAVVCAGTLSCSTPPPPAAVPFDEQLRQDHATGRVLAEELEGALTIRRDVEVEVFLRNLAQRMVERLPELRNSPVGVLVIANIDGQWRDLSLPGNRIYLSVNLLREMEFENEVAAAIAFELAHLMKRHAARRFEMPIAPGHATGLPLSREGEGLSLPPHLRFFGPTGVFTFPDDNYISSVEAAVSILYDAGIDPRGLTALWQLYRKNSKVSPYDANLLDRLVEQTRSVNALYSPLRNPVVRSAAFIKIQKRIRKL